jgi:hypothetical protein
MRDETQKAGAISSRTRFGQAYGGSSTTKKFKANAEIGSRSAPQILGLSQAARNSSPTTPDPRHTSNTREAFSRRLCR